MRNVLPRLRRPPRNWLDRVVAWFDSAAFSYRLTTFGHVRSLLYKLRIRLLLRDGMTPVIVYQMGKVASQTMVATLGRVPAVYAFHAHMLNPDNIERRRLEFEALQGRERATRDLAAWMAIYEELITSGRSVKIVTLIREPIGRNISAFFQGLDRRVGVGRAHTNVALDVLISEFKTKFNQSIPVEWFDRELAAVTSIDVYQYPFPKHEGHQRIHNGRFDVLIMRHDLPDSVKAKCVSEFLGIPDIEIVRDNESDNKVYADCYRAFQAAIRLSPEYIEELLGSKYARHFYPEEEIDRLRAKWLKLEKPVKESPAVRK